MIQADRQRKKEWKGNGRRWSTAILLNFFWLLLLLHELVPIFLRPSCMIYSNMIHMANE